MSGGAGYRRIVLPAATAAVGAVLGAAVAAGTTLLLHPGPGVLAAAGYLLALALGAVAAAAWVGLPDDRAVSTRGRWMAAILVFAAAGLFGDAYAGVREIRSVGPGTALAALLFLGAPAYAAGSVLTALTARRRGGAAIALVGAAAGVVAAATLLIPKLDPGVLYFAAGAVLLVAGMAELRWAPAVAWREDGTMNGKVVIVTGVGARGQVGYALARAFLEQGARVAITDVRPDVEALARELGDDGEVLGLAADLTEPDGAERVVAAVRDRFGRLDVLVNAAGGLSVIKPLAETTVEEWEREISRNARTAFLLSRAALPLLRESRGAIVNFASPAALRAAANLGAYSAAKAGVAALTRAMALEEAPNGVRVNAIAPGMIDTEQNRAAVDDPTAVKWVTREQIAAAVLFLAGDAGSGVNGEVVAVVGEGVG
ncbi:MAG TPA: SDR family NAD(P)-dependent oxidoreductase [Longimicrobiales bacterium]